MSTKDALQEYCDQDGMHHFEGERGVRNLESIVEVLGYNGRFSQSSLHEFLEDNPGAQKALLDWIGKQDGTTWEADLMEELDIDGDDDGEDEEEEDSDDDGLSDAEADAITLGERDGFNSNEPDAEV
jgi:hypothetical protein